MKCPECVKEDVKSCVFDEILMTTAMYCQPYYDEEGRHHHHDMNRTTTHYRCSNGHSWISSSSGACWCGWGKKSED